MIVGGVAGALIPFILMIYAYEQNPPPQRLIGKSPEYVNFYTDAYRTKARSIRTKSAAADAGGCLLIGGLLLLISTNE
jgi:hypothetical protein